jgi:uncharacterized protein (TIGR00304 family)
MTSEFVGLGILFLFIGFILIALAIMLSVVRESEGKVEGGGAILIGPFPIVFGTSKGMVKLILLVLIVILLAMLVFWR